ncbi:MAG: hypothetical protein HWE34_16905 [Methylocystaceae bacterium]|nr:hypothetical protein [Methylocystaceae bacterium]
MTPSATLAAQKIMLSVFLSIILGFSTFYYFKLVVIFFLIVNVLIFLSFFRGVYSCEKNFSNLFYSDDNFENKFFVKFLIYALLFFVLISFSIMVLEFYNIKIDSIILIEFILEKMNYLKSHCVVFFDVNQCSGTAKYLTKERMIFSFILCFSSFFCFYLCHICILLLRFSEKMILARSVSSNFIVLMMLSISIYFLISEFVNELFLFIILDDLHHGQYVINFKESLFSNIYNNFRYIHFYFALIVSLIGFVFLSLIVFMGLPYRVLRAFGLLSGEK